MAGPSSRVCPFCQGLNSADERSCYRCGRPLPGRATSGAIHWARSLLGTEAPASRAIIGLCLLVLALSVSADRALPLFMGQFSAWSQMRFGAADTLLDGIEPWRYLSAIFVHANLVHVGMNLFWFARIGGPAEQEFGSARFLLLCLLSGALGFVACDVWYALAGGGHVMTVGASGLVFGVFGSVVGVRYARRDPTWRDVLVQNVVYLAIMSLAFSVSTPAHVGGLATGALLGFLFSKEPRTLRLTPVFGILAVLLFLAAVAGVFLSAVSPFWRQLRDSALG